MHNTAWARRVKFVSLWLTAHCTRIYEADLFISSCKTLNFSTPSYVHTHARSDLVPDIIYTNTTKPHFPPVRGSAYPGVRFWQRVMFSDRNAWLDAIIIIWMCVVLDAGALVVKRCQHMLVVRVNRRRHRAGSEYRLGNKRVHIYMYTH